MFENNLPYLCKRTRILLVMSVVGGSGRLPSNPSLLALLSLAFRPSVQHDARQSVAAGSNSGTKQGYVTISEVGGVSRVGDTGSKSGMIEN